MRIFKYIKNYQTSNNKNRRKYPQITFGGYEEAFLESEKGKRLGEKSYLMQKNIPEKTTQYYPTLNVVNVLRQAKKHGYEKVRITNLDNEPRSGKIVDVRKSLYDWKKKVSPEIKKSKDNDSVYTGLIYGLGDKND